MRKRIFIAVAFIAGLFVVDRFIGYSLQRAFKGVPSDSGSGQLAEAVDKAPQCEVVVFGSSYAKHHVDPSILKTTDGWSCYNAGNDGQGIYYARMLEDIVLQKKNRCKLFILVVNPSDFFVEDIDRCIMLAQYADESPVIQRLLVDSDINRRIKLQSKAYAYNSQLPSLLRGRFASTQKRTDGFRPLQGTAISKSEYQSHVTTEKNTAFAIEPTLKQMLTKVAPPEGSNVELLKRKTALYHEFLKAASEHGIEVAIVFGPKYKHLKRDYARERFAQATLARLAISEGASYFCMDDQAMPAFQDIALYHDRTHLNEQGAALFTHKLAALLASEYTALLPTNRANQPVVK